MIDNYDKNFENINLGNDINANNEIQHNINSTMMILVKNGRMLKINKIAKSVCFHVIPYIHSAVKGFFRTFPWRPFLAPTFLATSFTSSNKWVKWAR